MRRGDVYYADLDPTRGREQAGRRPVLIVSADAFNVGPGELVVICPITSTIRSNFPSHVVVTPPEGGLKNASAVMCEAVRSVSKQRIANRLGAVSPATMVKVGDLLRVLLVL